MSEDRTTYQQDGEKPMGTVDGISRELLERCRDRLDAMMQRDLFDELVAALEAPQPATPAHDDDDAAPDLADLRRLALKATPGPWWVDSHGHCISSLAGNDYKTVLLSNDRMGPAVRHPETGNLSHWPNDWDATYIVNANPKTMLALLDMIDALRDGGAK